MNKLIEKKHNGFISILSTGIILGLLIPGLVLAVKLPEKHQPGPMYMPDQVIVKFKKGIEPTKKENLLSKVSAKEEKRLKHIEMSVLRAKKQGSDLNALVEQLSLDPAVESAEKIPMTYLQLTPSDPAFGEQWPLHNTGIIGSADVDIDAVEAWDSEDGSSSTIVVAVIDSGIDYTHPDLVANIWTNPGEDAWSDPLDPTTGNGLDDDGNGLVDDWKGWDFVGSDVFFTPPDNDPIDMCGHGTHVSGIVAATAENGHGGVGVNFHAKILPIKIGADSLLLNSLKALEAIDYLIDLKTRATNGVPNLRVINASWTQAAPLNALKTAIEAAGDAGILFVAAAGNGGFDQIGDDIDNPPLLQGGWPAAFDSKTLIGVAASDYDDLLADFSNFGATSVDLAAPGVYYYNTVPTYEVYLTTEGLSLDYDYLSGTSMASPCVAGAASLLFAADPARTVCDVKSLLMEYTDPVAGLAGLTVSGGRLNLEAAISGSVVDTDGDGTPDVCDDDNDDDGCEDATDPAPLTFSPDDDGDDYGSDCDCDDSDDQVNPGMTEIPGNGKDDDCNASTPPWGSAASMIGMKYSRESDIFNHLFFLIVPIGTLLTWKRYRRRNRR